VLRRRCPETRIVLLHPSHDTAPIASGTFFILWLAEVLGHGLKATMHQNHDHEVCALILTGAPPPVTAQGRCCHEWHGPSQPLPLFCDTLPTLQREAVEAFYRGIIIDLWSLSGRSLLRIRRSAWHTPYLLAYCQSTSMSIVCGHLSNSIWARSFDFFDFSCPCPWIRPAHLFITHSGIHYTCVIYLHTISLPFSPVTAPGDGHLCIISASLM
jgi:hypothetical protein